MASCSSASNTGDNPPDGGSHDAAPSCVDLADGESCGEGRLCLEGQCILSTCGDGVLDPGEECDDGNLILGDGCEIDCTFSCHHDDECLDEDLCTVGERCVEVPSGRRCLAGERIECPPEDANPCLMYTCDPDAAELGYCRSEALTGCYPDEDRDGFPLLDESRKVDPVGASCSCPETDELRYIHPRSDGRWDCDDTNERHYPGAAACFRDSDGDGYALIDDVDTMRDDCSCFAPYIHRRADGRWDCDDTSARVHPDARCLFDRDGDGYPSEEEAPAMDTSCACPDADSILDREDAAIDCDDTNAHIYPSAPCYPDADGDGFHVEETSGSMSASCECPSATIPFGARSLDCDDTNDDVFPGQSIYFETGYCPGGGKSASCPNAARSFDYNCSGAEEKEELCTLHCCDSYPFGCAGVPYWVGDMPPCGQVGTTHYCDGNCGTVSNPTRMRCR